MDPSKTLKDLAGTRNGMMSELLERARTVPADPDAFLENLNRMPDIAGNIGESFARSENIINSAQGAEQFLKEQRQEWGIDQEQTHANPFSFDGMLQMAVPYVKDYVIKATIGVGFPLIGFGLKKIGSVTYNFFQSPASDNVLVTTTATTVHPTDVTHTHGSYTVSHNHHIDLEIQDYMGESYFPLRHKMEHKKQQKIAAIKSQGGDSSAFELKYDAKIAEFTKDVAKILISKKHGNNLDFSVPPADAWLSARENTLNKFYAKFAK